MIEDLFLGFIISKLFGSRQAASPAVAFPSSPAPVPVPPPAAPVHSAPVPSPAAPALPAPPTFPVNVQPPPNVPQSTVPAGFKKAVEVWQIDPKIVQQAGPVVVGFGVGAEPMTVQMLEAKFPQGWVGKKSATAEESANAVRLLSQWKDGGVIFMGPSTLAARRAYRMTKHPAATASAPTVRPAPTVPPLSPATVPVSAPAAPTASPAPARRGRPPRAAQPRSPAAAPTVPASVPAARPAPAPAPAPAAPVQTLPEVLSKADAPAPAAPAPSQIQVTAVRKGEGLAQVAKRLGQPATAASATLLREANVPGPDGWFEKQDLSKGGLKKKNRAGGLQPGDRLFVPPQWGPVDAARL